MKNKFTFKPVLFSSLKDYTFKTFTADLGAGITVGIVALPLAMAFAIASGVSPQIGIATAIIAAFLISLFGGSKVQIGGPTGAFVVIIYGVIANYGYQNLLICTMIAGVILFLMGLMHMGGVIKYIPRPVTIGFTNGIAILIFSTQIKDFFGLEIEKVPVDFFPKIISIFENFASINLSTTLLALMSLGIIIFMPAKFKKIIPASIVALIAGTFIAFVFELNVETIGSKFGGIPDSLPAFAFPKISLDTIQPLIAPSLTIAILAAIESLLSAVVADGMTDDKHNSDQELMGQGIANMVVPFFGGIPVTGAIARTATNVKNGAKTPVSGIIHSITLLVILLVAAPLAKYIPLCTLAAVLFVVSFNMVDWAEFKMMPKMPRSDSIVFMTTFVLTIIFDLTIAVEVGMILAAMLFIKRVSDSTDISRSTSEFANIQNNIDMEDIPEKVLVFRVFGVLMFGAVDKLENVLSQIDVAPKVVILRMRSVMAMDATALNVLMRLQSKIKNRGAVLIITAAHDQPLKMMKKSGFINTLGEDNMCEDIYQALERSRQILAEEKSCSQY